MADVVFYELTEVVIPESVPGEFRLVTAALINCGLCGDTISGMGGPGHGPVCVRCAELLLRGDLRGAVIWGDA